MIGYLQITIPTRDQFLNKPMIHDLKIHHSQAT